MREDLAGFRDALLEQYKERYLALKRAMDDELADIITARRLKVEGVVYNLRRSLEKRLSEGLKLNRREAGLWKRKYRAAAENGFLERLEDALRVRFDEFRRSPAYGEAMIALAEEGVAALSPSPRSSSSFVVLVEKGDAAFLSLRGDMWGEIREELEDVWGGLVLAEAGRLERGRLVDNTFRTRWRRLRPFFVNELEDFFAEFDR